MRSSLHPYSESTLSITLAIESERILTNECTKLIFTRSVHTSEDSPLRRRIHTLRYILECREVHKPRGSTKNRPFAKRQTLLRNNRLRPAFDQETRRRKGGGTKEGNHKAHNTMKSLTVLSVLVALTGAQEPVKPLEMRLGEAPAANGPQIQTVSIPYRLNQAPIHALYIWSIVTIMSPPNEKREKKKTKAN